MRSLSNPWIDFSFVSQTNLTMLLLTLHQKFQYLKSNSLSHNIFLNDSRTSQLSKSNQLKFYPKNLEFCLKLVSIFFPTNTHHFRQFLHEWKTHLNYHLITLDKPIYLQNSWTVAILLLRFWSLKLKFEEILMIYMNILS